jgi:hypothetical protein
MEQSYAWEANSSTARKEFPDRLLLDPILGILIQFTQIHFSIILLASAE